MSVAALSQTEFTMIAAIASMRGGLLASALPYAAVDEKGARLAPNDAKIIPFKGAA